MSRYNLDPLLVSTGPTEDTANALLLREDLHSRFNRYHFVFVPKKEPGSEEGTAARHPSASSLAGARNHTP